MMTYTVQVTRDGKSWLLEVPELGIAGRAWRLADAEVDAASLVAAHLDVPHSEIRIKVCVNRS
ncbi:hypothetical protein QM806_28060 [Rhodococcus sp. IEGM 1351]|uniref:hypothetical protein n=1 Tax=Rhodococcus sp. IEGM 1351 TaxID=3047089 RepID=UPI0024B86A12|nr:hypothetical protein [Rhodococcus sp. IEGM 1351]MDI9939237.1 hypothetical protein [Rhodococcus sp. IEGM 1351]